MSFFSFLYGQNMYCFWILLLVYLNGFKTNKQINKQKKNLSKSMRILLEKYSLTSGLEAQQLNTEIYLNCSVIALPKNMGRSMNL